jgi:hypothetical protein
LRWGLGARGDRYLYKQRLHIDQSSGDLIKSVVRNAVAGHKQGLGKKGEMTPLHKAPSSPQTEQKTVYHIGTPD